MNAPVILDNVFDDQSFLVLQNLFLNYKNYEFQPFFSRYIVSDSEILELNTYKNNLIGLAKKTFKSNSLLPTYATFAHYEGKNPSPSLFKHKDDNACTYTIDFCLYQNEPWDLYVSGVPYTLYPNQALAYYGNDQLHWRENFPSPGTNKVAMIFFHFAEPDHWFFVKGPSYLSVIRGELSEEEWARQVYRDE